MDDGICFSPGALALLAAIGAGLQGAIVTLFWLLIRSKDAQATDAKGREAEWKRLALRGVNDIIPPLASAARAQIAEQIRELRGLQEPGS